MDEVIAALLDAIQHIAVNCDLASDDLKAGDGYEALEYLDNMYPWINAIREIADKLCAK